MGRRLSRLLTRSDTKCVHRWSMLQLGTTSVGLLPALCFRPPSAYAHVNLQ